MATANGTTFADIAEKDLGKQLQCLRMRWIMSAQKNKKGNMNNLALSKKIKKVISLKGLVTDEVYKDAIEKTLITARSCNMQDAAAELVEILKTIESTHT